MTKIYKMPETKALNKEQETDLHSFFIELVALCNKYRVTFAIGKIFLLHKEAADGKLLDVAGFSYNKDDEHTYPVYVDRLS